MSTLSGNLLSKRLVIGSLLLLAFTVGMLFNEIKRKSTDRLPAETESVVTGVEPVAGHGKEVTTRELYTLLHLTLSKKEESNWIDDALKVGLPLLGAICVAAIGYVATLRAAGIQKKSELFKDYVLRKSERCATIVKNINSFNQSLSLYATTVRNLRTSVPEKNLTAEDLAAIEKSQNAFFLAFLSLSESEESLIFLNCIEQATLLRQFGEEAQRFYEEVHVGNKEITDPDVEERMKQLRESRKRLMVSIGQAEENWWRSAAYQGVEVSSSLGK